MSAYGPQMSSRRDSTVIFGEYCLKMASLPAEDDHTL